MADNYRLTSTGVVFTGDLTTDEWKALGRKIAQIANGSIWAVGDWLVYGLGRGEPGETYALAQLVTGRSYDSLSQLTRVSEEFRPEQRWAKVPWTHYRAALRLPIEDRLNMLEAAESERWSADRLSREIESLLATVTGRPAREIPVESHRISALPKRGRPRVNRQIRCPECGHRWTARLGRNLDEAGGGG